MSAKITVGGVIILIDERGGLFVRHKERAHFVASLFALPGVKDVQGPLVTSVWTITAAIDNDQTVGAHVDRLTKGIRRVWGSHAS